MVFLGTYGGKYLEEFLRYKSTGSKKIKESSIIQYRNDLSSLSMYEDMPSVHMPIFNFSDDLLEKVLMKKFNGYSKRAIDALSSKIGLYIEWSIEFNYRNTKSKSYLKVIKRVKSIAKGVAYASSIEKFITKEQLVDRVSSLGQYTERESCYLCYDV